jgi:hypothetical protein
LAHIVDHKVALIFWAFQLSLDPTKPPDEVGSVSGLPAASEPHGIKFTKISEPDIRRMKKSHQKFDHRTAPQNAIVPDHLKGGYYIHWHLNGSFILICHPGDNRHNLPEHNSKETLSLECYGDNKARIYGSAQSDRVQGRK